MIPYKEYAACKADEGKVLTTSNPTLEEEENWDKDPPLPPCEIPPGAKPMVLSQEDEWKLMVNQDPHSGSVAEGSGHGMMTVTQKTNLSTALKSLLG